MMKRLIGVFVALALCAVPRVVGQNFEDEFNAFVNQNEQVFNRFSDSINRQFAEAMEANMRMFSTSQPKVRDSKPKPEKLPEVKTEDDPKEQPTNSAPKPKESLEAIENPGQSFLQPSVPSEESILKPSEQLNWLDFELFGENVRYVKNQFPENMTGISPKDVSAFWIQLSESEYGPLLEVCRVARDEKGFNDWALYQLVLEMARHTYPNLYNEQAVMAVFLLNQLGMEAKVGFSDTHLFCLLAVKQQIYGISFTKIANNCYYVFENNPKFLDNKERLSFHTYDISFPEPTKELDMNIQQPLKSADFPDIIDSAINISTSMLELFSTYPQVDIDVYANACPSSVFCQSVEKVFQPYLRSRTPVEAVDFLLDYVQYGFEYARDEEQFGYEKPFFCEECYYYPQNDCDDRAVLFSFLVRHLLQLDVVLVEYPGHIATAVHFNEEVPGSSIIYEGKRYVICDPAYIGAPVGKEMPDFAPEERTVIPIGRR